LSAGEGDALPPLVIAAMIDAAQSPNE